MLYINWASSRQNLSSGFLTMRDSNKSPQLQILTLISLVASLLRIFSQIRYNKAADQSVWMCSLVCAFILRKPPKTDFLVMMPNCFVTLCVLCLFLMVLWFIHQFVIVAFPDYTHNRFCGIRYIVVNYIVFGFCWVSRKFVAGNMDTPLKSPLESANPAQS